MKSSLEEVYQLMLKVRGRQSEISLKIIQNEFKKESDKTIIVQRENGEFGFRIHGSKPVVVSAIEPDTPAEKSGLEIGDIVISVNGINVLDKSHSEVVKIAHSGSDILELEVARTCDIIAGTASGRGEPNYQLDSLYAGYLWKYVPERDKWVRRWFCLKRNNCLYYYKGDTESQPIGALMLYNYELNRLTIQIIQSDDTNESLQLQPFSIKKPNSLGLTLAADTDDACIRWLAVISHAIESSASMIDSWLEKAKRNLNIAADFIDKPDCFGYLMKLGNKYKNWSKKYCVLKDACLYFYSTANSKSALGMACLHGYHVQQVSSGNKKYVFELIPSNSNHKHFYFHTDAEFDRKRWVAALEYSIDRWLRLE